VHEITGGSAKHAVDDVEGITAQGTDFQNFLRFLKILPNIFLQVVTSSINSDHRAYTGLQKCDVRGLWGWGRR